MIIENKSWTQSPTNYHGKKDTSFQDSKKINAARAINTKNSIQVAV